MVTPPDIEAQILRYYHAEKWTVSTIARQLHVHHSVVRRVLAQAGLPRIGAPPRKSLIDAYLPFIRQTVEAFPTLTASRLYVMVRERGYPGRPDHFRHLIACHRPRRKSKDDGCDRSSLHDRSRARFSRRCRDLPHSRSFASLRDDLLEFSCN